MLVDSRATLLFTALFACASISCKENPGAQVGAPVPGFTLPDLEGRMRALDELKGKVVVLNYWATWCPPCIEEMPSLEKLHEALASKGLVVVAVSVDERLSDIERFVDEWNLTFTVLHDNGMKVSRSYQTFKYPETYIIDRSGRLKSKVVGARDWVAPSVIRDLVALLNAPSSAS